MEILVVDDSKLIREMVIASLRGLSNASFTQAASGLEAIEKLSLSPFDLVFLDLNMPDLGGVEVVEFIREQESMQELPVVIVTTRGDEASRTRVLSAGATRFMTKPFDPEEIVAVARALVSAEPVLDG